MDSKLLNIRCDNCGAEKDELLRGDVVDVYHGDAGEGYDVFGKTFAGNLTGGGDGGCLLFEVVVGLPVALLAFFSCEGGIDVEGLITADEFDDVEPIHKAVGGFATVEEEGANT